MTKELWSIYLIGMSLITLGFASNHALHYGLIMMGVK